MTETTQAALSLLERLLDLTRPWNRRVRPVLTALRPEGMGLLRWVQAPERIAASRALTGAGYYTAESRLEWQRAIRSAIEALKGDTT